MRSALSLYYYLYILYIKQYYNNTYGLGDLLSLNNASARVKSVLLTVTDGLVKW